MIEGSVWLGQYFRDLDTFIDIQTKKNAACNATPNPFLLNKICLDQVKNFLEMDTDSCTRTHTHTRTYIHTYIFIAQMRNFLFFYNLNVYKGS